jgi:hypothetical protein
MVFRDESASTAAIIEKRTLLIGPQQSSGQSESSKNPLDERESHTFNSRLCMSRGSFPVVQTGH